MRSPNNIYSTLNTSQLNAYGARLGEAIAVRAAERAAEEAKLAAEMSIRVRSEFLSNMNHELRTPLNAIIGFASMLKEMTAYNLDEEQTQQYADYILQSADLLLSHINTILEAAALDGGDLALTVEAVNFGEALTAAVERSRIAADSAEVRIENKTAQQPPPGAADPVRLGQVLDHVLRTAIRLSPSGSRIFVRATHDGQGWPEIAVRDRSAGMSEEEIASALNAFSQVNRGLDRSFSGPGINLAIAKSITELQGGRFRIKSRLNEGTLVTIAFPPAEKAEQPVDDARDNHQPMKLAG